MNVLPKEKQIQVIAALTEGVSIRATERLTDVHRDTIMRLGVRVGEGCARVHDRLMRNLNVNLIEMDEQWAFIGKKQKRVEHGDSPEMGDCWLWIALDATNKAVLSFVVGKRSPENAMRLTTDLRARVVNRPQITTDGHRHYLPAMDEAFGPDADYGQVVKTFAGQTTALDAAHRYSPGEVIGVERTVISGDPDYQSISTSYVERFNLTTRMQMRRFTRLTSGFSRKLANHRSAIALYIAWYNLCRVHETLRVTPAMAVGVSDHVWTIEELVDAALSAPEPSPLPTGPKQRNLPGMSAGQAKKAAKTPFRLIPGGLGPRRPIK